METIDNVRIKVIDNDGTTFYESNLYHGFLMGMIEGRLRLVDPDKKKICLYLPSGQYFEYGWPYEVIDKECKKNSTCIHCPKYDDCYDNLKKEKEEYGELFV